MDRDDGMEDSDSITSTESDGESDFDEDAYSFSDEGSETPLGDDEVQDLIDELLVVESKAAEAQELLEVESLVALKDEVRAELSSQLSGSELEAAVEEEMSIYVEQWQDTLDELEDRSGLLQENLDAAGVDLADLFKWIEKQAPQGCTTEAWKKRTHWAGLSATEEVTETIKKAEQDLECVRPVNRRHGKVMEEGASGFLGKQFLNKSAANKNSNTSVHSPDDWEFVDAVLENENNLEKIGFGTKKWASVYLAATPEQASLLGIPGADEVEEIIDLEKCKKDFLTAAALASEKEHGLTEQQKRNLKKVREEDDIKKAKMMDSVILKSKRKKLGRSASSKIQCSEDVCDQMRPVATTTSPSNDINCKSNIFVNSRCQDDSDDKKDVSMRNLPMKEIYDKINDKIIIDLDSDVDEENILPMESSGDCKVSCYNSDGKGGTNVTVQKTDSELVPYQAASSVGVYNNTHEISFECTVCCGKLLFNEVRKHPLFDVIICKRCKRSYENTQFSKDTSGIYNQCCWCANGGELVMCDKCDKVFCSSCITSNFGKDEFEEILKQDWVGYCCNPEALKPKVECFMKADALRPIDLEEIDPSELRRHEKRRKRLRRILEDDELEESTILKQRLEKERKERLDRLRETAIAGNSSLMPINATAEDCPINIARDVDEEEVFIPFGIAKFLKPHQIEGVRFMWENCIESLKKVKSGHTGNGCILAHNMGLGKTLQVISFLYTVLKRGDLGLQTALIVTPVNVLHNWPDEFEKWRPSDVKKLRVYVLDETTRNDRVAILNLWQRKGGVMMIGYTAFRTMSSGKYIKDAREKDAISSALQNPGPDILICDEAHMIKNKKADITQALKLVKTQRRIALTGSPLQNNLMEYYCMVDFVREGFLGRPQDFKNRFQNPIENGQHADSTEYDVRCMKERTHVLHKQLMGFVQRKGAHIVEAELPKKIIYVLSVRLSQLQRSLYNRFVQMFWLSSVSSESKSRKSLFPTYHALAKVWNHPDLIFAAREEKGVLSGDSTDEMSSEDGLSSDDENNEVKKLDKRNSQKNLKQGESEIIKTIESLDWCKDLINDMPQGMLDNSGKFVLLLDILAMSSALCDKVLVFSQSLPTLNLIESFLEKMPRPKGKPGNWRKDKEWYRLDGHTKARERQQLVKRFNDPSNTKAQCVLISTKAGSLGINLQAANRVVIIDGSWNPTHDIQALFRSWRFGQKKPVFVYRLLAHGTAEEKIYMRQVAKEGLAARVLDAQQVGRHSKMEELKVLFTLDDDTTETTETGKTCEEVDNCTIEANGADHDSPEDEIMTSLLNRHRPKWIVRIHQHDTLLVDREDEKLTLEEQDLAWERFKQITENDTFDWVEGGSQSGDGNSSHVQNTWGDRAHPPLPSNCSAKFHVELLATSNIKNNEHVKCETCQQMIGWEHIVKSRQSRGSH